VNVQALPRGWGRSTLGEVASVIRNGTFASRPNDDPAGVPILRISAVRDGAVDTQNVKYVHGLDAARIDQFTLNSGDLLFTRYNGSRHLVGICGLVPQHSGPILHPDKLIRVVISSDIADSRFVAYQMASGSVRSHLEPRIRTTAGQSGISGVDIKSIPLILPPLEEQRRIVDVLEDRGSRLETGASWLEAASVKAAALRNKMMSRVLDPEHWPEVPLISLLDLSIGGIWGDPVGVSEQDVRVLRVTELRPTGGLDPSTAAVRSCTAAQYRSRALRGGDLLLEKSGGGPTTPVGRVGLVPHLTEPSVCSNFMQLMRPDKARVHPDYLHLFLTTAHIAGRTASMQTASTNIRNIKASSYVQVLVVLPDLDEQRRLVDEVKLAQDQCLAAENQVSLALRRVARLKHALLNAAFSGHLSESATVSEFVEELASV
jgi:type I restriction enzyme, S subunit